MVYCIWGTVSAHSASPLGIDARSIMHWKSQFASFSEDPFLICRGSFDPAPKLGESITSLPQFSWRVLCFIAGVSDEPDDVHVTDCSDAGMLDEFVGDEDDEEQERLYTD